MNNITASPQYSTAPTETLKNSQGTPKTLKSDKKAADTTRTEDFVSLSGSDSIKSDEDKLKSLKDMARKVDAKFDSCVGKIGLNRNSALCVAGIALACLVQPWYLGAAILGFGLFTPFEYGGAVI
ncbi:MAG: hypothetical protein AB9903_03510 [Vulcanimicrobiota bacterium]